MSSSTPWQSSATSSDFKSILDTALRKYEEKTGKQLLDDPLAAKLQGCESVNALVFAVNPILLGQVEEFRQLMDGDQRSMKWTSPVKSPVVNILHAFSDTLGPVGRVTGIVKDIVRQ